MSKVKIMIADDHWMVRDGLKQLLELNDTFSVVAEANNGSDCGQLIDDVDADVLLLDINMPDINGLQVLSSIKRKNDSIKIIMLTIHNEPEYMNKAMNLGADGYVLKDSDSNVLTNAITMVIKGEQFIDRSLLPYYFSDTNKVYEKESGEALTDREIEVLILMTQGLYNKEIGYKLGISEKTVKNHASNIFRKINVNDRTQAALYAIKNNYVCI